MSLLPRLSDALRRVLDGFGKPSPIGRFAEQVELGERLNQLAKLGEAVDSTGNNETVGADLILVPDPNDDITADPKTVGNILRELAGGAGGVVKNATTGQIAGGDTHAGLTPTPINGMTLTEGVAPGFEGDDTWLVFFDCDIRQTQNNGSTTFSIYVGGVLVPNTEKTIMRGAGQGDVQQGVAYSGVKITVAPSDVVEIRWNTNGADNTVTIGNGHLSLEAA